jgi:hypothetical protein
MVWAIGYVGDETTAAELKKLLTGEPCDHPHESGRTDLCQYELQKAIEKTGGGVLPFLRH